MASSQSHLIPPISINHTIGSETDSFVFQVDVQAIDSQSLKDFNSKCAMDYIKTIIVDAQKVKHVVAIFSKPMLKPNACRTLIRLAKESGLKVNSDLDALDVFHAETFGWKELPAQPDLHKCLPEDDDNFDPHRNDVDLNNQQCERAEQEADDARQRADDLLLRGGISDEEGTDELAALHAPNTVALIIQGMELQIKDCTPINQVSKPENFKDFQDYKNWLTDVPAKWLQSQTIMSQKISHVTMVDAIRMGTDRRLEWVLFRLAQAGLTLQPMVEHFPPFYYVLCSTMERGTPHAKFDLAKKLFTKWANQQDPDFSLPSGRIEKWPIDLRCKVQTITKGKEVMLCHCGRPVMGKSFCSDECQMGRCKTCSTVLTMAAVGPWTEISTNIYWEYMDTSQKTFNLEALKEKTVEQWRQHALDIQNSCLECSEFEEVEGMKRMSCSCNDRLSPCADCEKFERVCFTERQRCNMCHFHIYDQFVQKLDHFQGYARKYDLDTLKDRLTQLRVHVTPTRSSIAVCPVCPNPAKRQRVEQ
jgi:hypothetical protein